MMPAHRYSCRAGAGRIERVEQVKGLAILLVVAAHLVKHQSLASPDWYELFKFKVYLFHMPLFMFVSGYVFFHSGAHLTPPARLAAYVLRRADRLLVPFLALGVLTVCGKLLLAQRVHVDDVPPTLLQALLSLLTHTERSPALTVWYLFVLFVFCSATPLLYRLAGQRLGPMILLAACLYPLAPPDMLFANRVTAFYIFFVAGGVAHSLQAMERRVGPGASVLFGVAFLSLLAAPLDRPAGLLLCGLASALAVPAALQWLPVRLQVLLGSCGRQSMAIYLFNVIAIGIAKAAFLQAFAYRADLFIPLLIVTFCAGLGGPLLIKRLSGLSPRTALFHRYIS
ncbi:MAG TPA: acyltransferase [Noviherbaspirillum sp.]|jgi:surface polysaccharide O-acyltransferase-like enzyme|uniref:acyltransferase family protein n=1 Tax=Noviherbaspirillum sp. TaxID=1926288 RepID=UPI002F95A69F